MTYEQYWYGDPLMVKYYRKADLLRQERMNDEAWLRGMYIYDAIGRLAPILQAFAKAGTKPEPYIDKPYPITQQERKQEKKVTEEQEALLAKVYMSQMVEAGKNWGKRKRA